MNNDKNIFQINFSKKYEKGLKIEKIIFPFILLLFFLPAPFTNDPFKYTFFIALPVYLLTLFAYLYSRLSGEGKLPKKVRIDENGIYAWKRSKKEEFISWDKVHKIRIMDRITPNDYLVVINKSGKNAPPKMFEYHELALDTNSAQIEKSKFNEYKAKKGNM